MLNISKIFLKASNCSTLEAEILTLLHENKPAVIPNLDFVLHCFNAPSLQIHNLMQRSVKTRLKAKEQN